MNKRLLCCALLIGGIGFTVPRYVEADTSNVPDSINAIA